MAVFTKTITAGPNQIISLGRRVSRCYKRVNASESFGRAAGLLQCVKCLGARQETGGMIYTVTLADVDTLPSGVTLATESADFSALEDDFDPSDEQAAPVLPPLSWTPPSEGA